MPQPREFVVGPWRAVSVLGITQIITWGVLFYPPVLTMPLIARERGWSLSFAMGGFSLALFVGGLVAPRVGALIDRYGGHVVLPCGSLIAAIGLVALVHATHWLAYLAVWMLLGVAMAAQLYDAAFATLGRVFGAAAATPAVMPAKGWTFVLVATAFGAYAFVPSGLSAHLLAIFGRAGIDAATVVAIGALFGPSQVAARLCEFIFAKNLHPLVMVRAAVTLLVCAFAVLALLGISLATATAFAVMFGAANGLFTIARGTVPLALFGPAGYGLLVGRLAKPWLLMQSMAPLALAFVAERTSDAGVLIVVAAFAVLALVCLSLIRRPSVAENT